VFWKFGEKKSRCFGNFGGKNVGALEIWKKTIVIQNFGIDSLIKRILEVKNFQSRIAFLNTK